MCSAERIVDMLPLLKELFMPSLKLEYPRKGAAMLNVLAAVAYVFAITSANAQEGTLIAAALRGDLPRVRVLLDAKAEVNARDSDGKTALMIASEAGHADVVRVLLDAKADVNAKAGVTTALREATLNGHADVVQLLKNAGADR
jgi:ankyrin repeat protein